MSSFRTLLLTAIVLATTACASNAVKNQAVPIIAEARPPPSAVSGSRPNTAPVQALALPAPQDAASATGGAAAAGGTVASESSSRDGLGAEAADSPVHIRDPWEGFNRRMHSFNDVADKFVLRPLAVGYDKITPVPVQAGVSRFFANLRMPTTVVNQALQGRPGDAGKSLGRFAINTTVGIAGVFDPASNFGMLKRGDEDFGQTLATWGWRDSRYLVLPLLGACTVRDAVGIVGDQPLAPTGQIQDSGTASGLQLIEIVDMRTRMLPIDKFRRDALDDYAFVRDAWAQRRNQQIQQDLRSDRD